MGKYPISNDQMAPTLILIGRSAAARRLSDDMQAAAAASCVLLEAEAGLDTVDIAREIHARSGRAGSFVAVECAGAEPSNVEREIFGERARRGASDFEALAPRAALAEARGGTLYLGDLTELSATAQGRLARVARDGEAWVAGTDHPCPLNVSLIASTSSDLESETKQGRLRRELLRYFTRTRIAVPALRQRAEDIPLLVDRFIACLSNGADAPPRTLTQAAATLLSAMPWRGNVVELRQAVARLMELASGPVIQLEDVLAHVRFDGVLAPGAPDGTLRSARRQFEREYIALVLQHHRWRIGDAARSLGIQRTNLYRKARQLGISMGRHSS
jgi:two-component system nitrogen regulation response regulator NtrX